MPTQSPQHGHEERHVFSDRTITVLLVDDQEIVAEAVRRMLSGEPDIKLEYCQDPTKALDMARKYSPDPHFAGFDHAGHRRFDPGSFFQGIRRHATDSVDRAFHKGGTGHKAEAFARGANDYLVKLPDKIELIARIRYHSKAYITLLERNETYEALLASQAALNSELMQAAAYVRALLPPRLAGDIRTDWEFIPSTSLGGDSFGYHWIDADHFAMYLLDVCGHGVGAALLSISVINTLRSESLSQWISEIRARFWRN
jgi:sigma-B regulation protein RsbU (phosphoserine phosphatase)